MDAVDLWVLPAPEYIQQQRGAPWPGEFFSQKSEALAQASQGGGGVTVPKGVQETWRCGSQGHGLWVLLVVGEWLD